MNLRQVQRKDNLKNEDNPKNEYYPKMNTTPKKRQPQQVRGTTRCVKSHAQDLPEIFPRFVKDFNCVAILIAPQF